MADVETVDVDGIPVSVTKPPAGTAGRDRLALWLHYFTGTKEQMQPQLNVLAERGFVAVSLDAWRHGARATRSMAELSPEVFGHFRRDMWPILGQTTLDAMHVIDWALDRYQLAPDVVAGGISMGGDTALALAGADPRVSAVAALVATPDWTRPGMHRLDDPTLLIDQGAATPHGQWLYDHLNPATHLGRYARAPRIRFELGGADTHVPPSGAVEFRAALAQRYPAAARAITIRLAEGLGHLDAIDEPALTRALDWLSA
ncbi:MAG: prolyl oligopeptidase family serine peptidase [Micromonosporaceae bacterium]|nr:prolyl oligopeptidase family serine peptidase [Micromonosporaceae bacterium]